MNKDDILIVVVLYNEHFRHSNTYQTLVKPNPDSYIYVYDNSPQVIPQNATVTPNCQYVSDILNPGLSYAYNQAAKYAQEHGYSWLLLCDQDTLFAPDILEKYVVAINENSDIKILAPLMAVDSGLYMSPIRRRFCGGKLEKHAPRGIISLKKYNPINSGLMVNVSAFWKVGGYNERVRLDFSDYQFIERFSKVYNDLYIIDTVCCQEFSDQVQSKEQKMARFTIFCNCLKMCDKNRVIDYFSYLCIVLRRAISLIVSTRSFSPLHIFLTKYL